MPILTQLNITAQGEVISRVVRGSDVKAAWALADSGAPIDLSAPIGAVTLTDGSTLDLTEFLTTTDGAVGLHLPTAGIPSGTHTWTVQASCDGRVITLATGPFIVMPSDNFPEE